MQFLPLMRADDPSWLIAWIATFSLADSLYWPVYHSACAVICTDGSRGRELGLRTAIGAWSASSGRSSAASCSSASGRVSGSDSPHFSR
jgi:hypothetical protein